jgi:hypothetical protein
MLHTQEMPIIKQILQSNRVTVKVVPLENAGSNKNLRPDFEAESQN